MQVYLRGMYGDQVRWRKFLEQLTNNLDNLLLDWTLEICCFETTLGLPGFLTKHKKSELFRKWYPVSILDNWEEVIRREIKDLHLESWCKMTEREKINKLVADLEDILKKEESIGEHIYFGNKITTKILENLPKEIKESYAGRYEGWLCLRDPLLQEFAKNKRSKIDN